MPNNQSQPIQRGITPETALDLVVQLLTHEGELLWSRYNVYLAANSFLIAALGIAAGVAKQQLFSLCVSFAGLLLCACWYLITRRSFIQCDHYFRSLVEIESRCSQGDIIFFGATETFGLGGQVHHPVGGKPKTLRLRKWGKFATTPRIAHFTIGVFAALYFVMLTQLLMALLRH